MAKTATAGQPAPNQPPKPKPKPLTEDEKIRAVGFRIAERANGKPAVWERAGRRVEHACALDIANRKLAAAEQQAETAKAAEKELAESIPDLGDEAPKF